MGSLRTYLLLFLTTFFLTTSCGTGPDNSSNDEAVFENASRPPTEEVEEIPITELSDCIPCNPEGPCAPAYAAFQEMYPEVTEYICCKRRSMLDNWCEFIFEEGALTIEVEFGENGQWFETEEENLPVQEVPQAVLAELSKRFPKGEIIKCERETTPYGIFYEIDLRFPDGGENEYYYTPGGTYLQGQNRYED